MDKVPVAYNTICSDIKSGSILDKRTFEAINKDEAITRAVLNCIKAGNRIDSIVIEAKRI